MKTSIDCYLELYIKEINSLHEKALELYSHFTSKPVKYWQNNPNELMDVNEKINKIKRHEAALIECKNQSIASI